MVSEFPVEVDFDILYVIRVGEVKKFSNFHGVGMKI